MILQVSVVSTISLNPFIQLRRRIFNEVAYTSHLMINGAKQMIRRKKTAQK